MVIESEPMVCHCGHDRRGIPEDMVCPECGEFFSGPKLTLLQAFRDTSLGYAKVAFLLGVLNVMLAIAWIITLMILMGASGGGANFAPLTMAMVYFPMFILDVVSLAVSFPSQDRSRRLIKRKDKHIPCQ